MPGRQSSSISAALAVALAVAGIFSATAQNPPAQADPLHCGESLFLGKLPLQGKPRDQVDYLPTPVVRCVNCHGEGKLKLDSSLLLETRQRRHGPPSVYDQTKFCKLLHTGIDPAYIMIDHIMPIYDMPDSDCAALWTYITRKDSTKDSPNAHP